MVLAAAGAAGAPAAGGTTSSGPDCDEQPTRVAASDHWLSFTVPSRLTPDPRFWGRPARLHVHRVRPVYANGKCPGVRTRAAVLIHGRTATGPPMFDLRGADGLGGRLSMQKALARAGIDTFAASLLGYGRSTRFEDGLDDPGNASLRPYEADAGCPHSEGCDRTFGPNPLDQQGDLLLVNPLEGQRRSHSSNQRFARIDVWVRDIRQLVDDAIARAQPTDSKVALVGYSAGGIRVGRTLYADDHATPFLAPADVTEKLSAVVYLSSIFRLGPTEEPPGVTAPTFPLTLTTRAQAAAVSMPPGREAACTGLVIPGGQERSWTQQMEHDALGAQWGGDDPAEPTGLLRSPTFSTYGWNDEVARALTRSPPALVIHGLDDVVAPPANSSAIYENLPVADKVLVQMQCASHNALLEGCDGPRCSPFGATPYGGTPGRPWAGPHATVKAALIEWITNSTFDGATSGRFIVDESGVARPAGP